VCVRERVAVRSTNQLLVQSELMLGIDAAGVSGLENKGSAAELAISVRTLQFGVQQTLPHRL
jgi:hypothetical protein